MPSKSLEKSFSRQRQTDIFLGSLRGKQRSVPISFEKLKEVAQKGMSSEAFAYITGSAGNEETKKANESDFNHWQIIPSMLNDVSTCDTSVSLFGQKYPVPFLLAMALSGCKEVSEIIKDRLHLTKNTG